MRRSDFFVVRRPCSCFVDASLAPLFAIAFLRSSFCASPRVGATTFSHPSSGRILQRTFSRQGVSEERAFPFDLATHLCSQTTYIPHSDPPILLYPGKSFFSCLVLHHRMLHRGLTDFPSSHPCGSPTSAYLLDPFTLSVAMGLSVPAYARIGSQQQEGYRLMRL